MSDGPPRDFMRGADGYHRHMAWQASERAEASESDARCDTAALDEARDAAEAALYRYAQDEWGWGSHEYHSVIGAVDVVLDAIDLPRVRAEERAATLREVEALREALDMAIYHADNLRRFISKVPVRDLAESEAGFQRAKAIAAHFNPEAE